ncbi:unnamed protein product [Darwinula stevensoni]|uniref:Uncharacterized protein n=1 Tax=Darwinula stevensoni TaxID=69355 RepID=A0A7R8XB69_9CRUS|nr:unnamed protein product [Darwinula stevensoni]CAG0890740.1 unnamed protein product [Darwinula stevensoni]
MSDTPCGKFNLVSTTLAAERRPTWFEWFWGLLTGHESTADEEHEPRIEGGTTLTSNNEAPWMSRYTAPYCPLTVTPFCPISTVYNKDIANKSLNTTLNVEIISGTTTIARSADISRAHGSHIENYFIELKNPLTFSPTVQPICVAKGFFDANSATPCKQTVFGWGEINDQHQATPFLKKVDVKRSWDCSGGSNMTICIHTEGAPQTGICNARRIVCAKEFNWKVDTPMDIIIAIAILDSVETDESTFRLQIETSCLHRSNRGQRWSVGRKYGISRKGGRECTSTTRDKAAEGISITIRHIALQFSHDSMLSSLVDGFARRIRVVQDDEVGGGPHDAAVVKLARTPSILDQYHEGGLAASESLLVVDLHIGICRSNEMFANGFDSQSNLKDFRRVFIRDSIGHKGINRWKVHDLRFRSEDRLRMLRVHVTRILPYPRVDFGILHALVLVELRDARGGTPSPRQELFAHELFKAILKNPRFPRSVVAEQRYVLVFAFQYLVLFWREKSQHPLHLLRDLRQARHGLVLRFGRRGDVASEYRTVRALRFLRGGGRAKIDPDALPDEELELQEARQLLAGWLLQQKPLLEEPRALRRVRSKVDPRGFLSLPPESEEEDVLPSHFAVRRAEHPEVLLQLLHGFAQRVLDGLRALPAVDGLRADEHAVDGIAENENRKQIVLPAHGTVVQSGLHLLLAEVLAEGLLEVVFVDRERGGLLLLQEFLQRSEHASRCLLGPDLVPVPLAPFLPDVLRVEEVDVREKVCSGIPLAEALDGFGRRFVRGWCWWVFVRSLESFIFGGFIFDGFIFYRFISDSLLLDIVVD